MEFSNNMVGQGSYLSLEIYRYILIAACVTVTANFFRAQVNAKAITPLTSEEPMFCYPNPHEKQVNVAGERAEKGGKSGNESQASRHWLKLKDQTVRLVVT